MICFSDNTKFKLHLIQIFQTVILFLFQPFKTYSSVFVKCIILLQSIPCSTRLHVHVIFIFLTAQIPRTSIEDSHRITQMERKQYLFITR